MPQGDRSDRHPRHDTSCPLSWRCVRIWHNNSTTTTVSPHISTPQRMDCDETWYRDLSLKAGRDSSVGIPTRHGLQGPGIESRWRHDFTHTPIRTLGPTQPPAHWVPGRGKAAGAWRWPPTQNLAPRLKKEYRYTSTSRLGLRSLF